MNEQEAMDLRIWDYIDATAAEADRAATGRLIATYPAWQQRYGELKGTHELLGGLETAQPSMRFSVNVMEAIGRTPIAPPARSYINKWIIRGVAAVFLLLVVVLLGTALTTIDWSGESTGRSFLTQWKPVSAAPLLNTDLIQWILPVNVIGGLLLLDTWLRRKRSAKLHLRHN